MQRFLRLCGFPAVGDQAVPDDNACKGGEGSAAVFPVFLGGMAERFAADLVKVIKPKSLYGLIDGNRSQYGAPYKVEVFFHQFPLP